MLKINGKYTFNGSWFTFEIYSMVEKFHILNSTQLWWWSIASVVKVCCAIVLSQALLFLESAEILLCQVLKASLVCTKAIFTASVSNEWRMSGVNVFGNLILSILDLSTNIACFELDAGAISAVNLGCYNVHLRSRRVTPTCSFYTLSSSYTSLAS